MNGLAGHHHWLDVLMVVSAKYAPVFYALVLLGCWLTWRPRWQRLAAIAGGAALVALGVGQLVGFAFHPTDVIGGAALGAIGGWAALRVAATPVVSGWIDAIFLFLNRIRIAARP